MNPGDLIYINYSFGNPNTEYRELGIISDISTENSIVPGYKKLIVLFFYPPTSSFIHITISEACCSLISPAFFPIH